MNKTLNTPKNQGYYMPAEWTPHLATWLAWPEAEFLWQNHYKNVLACYYDIIAALTPYEKIKLLISKDIKDVVLETCVKKGININQIDLIERGAKDIWIRDYGPTFLLNNDKKKPPAYVRWNFNAWGEKYQELLEDAFILDLIKDVLPLNRFSPNIILEGGSIEVNGSGIVMTTEQCLLNPNRNPHLSQNDIETLLHAFLGTNQVLWLMNGLKGDDTDGHIDDIARFTDEKTVAAVYTDNRNDVNFEAIQENYKRLKTFRLSSGESLDIIKLPPAPLLYDNGNILPTSYANFYIANKVVLFPVFNVPSDDEAIRIIQPLFPDRQVIPIASESLVTGSGAIHCITQQEPLAKS